MTNNIQDVWRTNALRITAFWTAPDLIDRTKIDSVLHQIYMLEPESLEIKKGDVFRQESVALGAGKVTFSASEARLDLVWQADEPTSDAQLGEPAAALNAFIGPAVNWLKGSTRLQRLALGAAFSIKADSREAANALLDKTIAAVTLPSHDVTDFIYQINNPTQVNIGNEIIIFNCLERWSYRQVDELIFNVMPHAQSNAPKNGKTSFFSTLELDLNTEQNRVGTFTPVLIEGCYQKMIEFVKNFVAK